MCLVNFTSIEGFRTPAGGIGGIRVTGVATDCSVVRVEMICRANPPAAPLLFLEVNVINGAWEAVFDQSNPDFFSNECQCGGYVAVHAFCIADPTCDAFYEGYLECPPLECPTITDLTVNVGQCNPDGTVTVTTSATVTPGAVSPVFVQWMRDGNPGRADVITNPNTVTHDDPFNYPGDGAVHAVTINVINPMNCGAISTNFNTPLCGEPPPVECPSIQPETPTWGDCDPMTGTRPVTLSAIVTPAVGSPAVTVELVDDATGMVLDTQTSAAQFVLSATRDYLPGMHTYSVHVVSPATCGDVSMIPFTVPGCEGAGGCPMVGQIVIGPESDCDAMGRRMVEVSVTVTPTPGVPTSAELVVDGIQIDVQNNRIAPFDLRGTRSYAPGPHSASVNILAPPGCVGPDAQPFQVSGCPMTPPPVIQTPPDDSDDFGCLFSRWIIVILLGIAAFLFFASICVPGASSALLPAAGIVLGVALVVLIFWLIFCGSPCELALLLWQASLVIGVVALYMSGCCPWLLFLGLGLILLAAILFGVWVSQCNPSTCVILRELSVAFVTCAGTALDVLGHVAPCGSWVVQAIAGIGATLITLYTLARCVARP